MGLTDFHEQLSTINSWFLNWNDCDRVFFLFSSLKKMHRKQLKFLSLVIEDKLQKNTSKDDLIEENHANDSNFLKLLLQRDMTLDTLKQFLYHLPLLKPGNSAAKHLYLSSLSTLLNSLSDTLDEPDREEYLEIKSQILSYLLIHPAIHREEISDVAFLINGLKKSIKSEPSQQLYNYNQVNEALNEILNTNNAFNSQKYPSKNQYNSNSFNNDNYNSQLTNYIKDNKFPIDNFDLSFNNLLNMDLMEHQKNSQSLDKCNDPIFSNYPHKDNYGLKPEVGQQEPHSGQSDMPPCSLLKSNTFNNLLKDSFAKLPLAACNSLPLSLEDTTNQQSSSTYGLHSGHQKLSRTKSIIPTSNISWSSRVGASTAASSILQQKAHPQQNNLGTTPQNNLSILPLHQHKPLSPQSSTASTDSNDSNQEKQINEESDQICVWLRSLRLHKYSGLFSKMTIDEMSTITEDWLLKHDVTKGASNKILLNIQKLQERQNIILNIEKELNEESFKMDKVLDDLLLLIKTPMKVGSNLSNERDLSDQQLSESFIILFGKLCTILLMEKYPDQNNLHTFIRILDSCNHHPAFSVDKKKKLIPWRHQINKLSQSINHQALADKTKISLQLYSNVKRFHQPLAPQRSNPNWILTNSRIASLAVSTDNSPSADEPKKSYINNIKQPLYRTRSAPMQTLALSFPTKSSQCEVEEQFVKLDDTMQKHALGDMFNEILHI